MTVQTRKHPVALVPSFIIWGIVLGIFLLGALALRNQTFWGHSYLQLFSLGMAALSGLRLLIRLVIWHIYHVRIERGRLTLRSGLFRTKTVDLANANITLSQNLLERLLDAGSVRLDLMDGQRLHLRNLHGFSDVRESITARA